MANSLADINTYYGVGFKSNQILVDSVDSINQQILNLLSTSPSELLFEPEFGSLVQYYLFEPIDATTAYNIKIWVLKAIERWLPFITMIPNKSSVIPDEINQGFNVKVVYSVVGTDQVGSIQAQLSRS